MRTRELVLDMMSKNFTPKMKSQFQIPFIRILHLLWSSIENMKFLKDVRKRVGSNEKTIKSLTNRENECEHTYKAIASKAKTTNVVKPRNTVTVSPKSFTSIMRNVLAATALTILPGMANATEMISIPFTVFLTTFPSDSAANSTFDKNDIFKLFAEVNEIWKGGGIQCDVNLIENLKISLQSNQTFSSLQDRGALRKVLLEISPKGLPERMWKVVIVNSFPVLGAGVYLPETKTIFYSETSRGGKNRAVNLAHEIGHSLGLVHVNKMENLMHPRHGSRDNEGVPTLISDDQIATSRKQALSGPMDSELAQHLNSPDNSIGTEQKHRSLDNKTREHIVDRFKKFDYDNDGEVHLSDIPNSKGKKIFHSIDKNSDDILDREELNTFRDSLEKQ